MSLWLQNESVMILCGYAVGGGGAGSGREMMADEEEEVKQILQKLQVGQKVKTYMYFSTRKKQGTQFLQYLRVHCKYTRLHLSVLLL